VRLRNGISWVPVCPWTDRAGRFSPLRLAAFVLALAPALWLATQAVGGDLGAKPVTEAIHTAGEWAVRFLLLTLAVTPLRHIAQWPQIMTVRRLLGLTALAYSLLHVGLYVVDQGYDLGRVAGEIVQRSYLTIGAAAAIGLIVLSTTSTDAMIRRLCGARWNRLHRTVYFLAVLGLVHHLLQSKADVTEPTIMAGVFLLLIGFRLLRSRGWRPMPLTLAGLALGASLLTAALEAAWYGLATGVSAARVLAANLELVAVPRPALLILGIGLGLVVLRAWSVKRPARGGSLPRRRAILQT